MERFKPMQWGFTTTFTNGRALLVSCKIVEYDRGRVRFSFVFDDDGKYERLIGVQWQSKSTQAPADKR
ncbi:MAG: hypothetical protein IPJ19_17800 [Planctomycetes bacterium]|nr:hypothetical protein [Planctomycetota bacterium]